MLLDAFAGFGVGPVGCTHEQIHAGPTTAALLLAAALVAVPGAGAVFVVKAVTIGAAAEGTGLMGIGELIGGKATELLQQIRPPAAGEVLNARHFAVVCSSRMTRSNSNLMAELRDMVLPRQASSQSSCAWDRRMGVGFASRIGAGRCLPIVAATATVGKHCNTAQWTCQTLRADKSLV